MVMWVPLGNPDNLPKALNFIMFVQSLYHVGEYIRRFWDKAGNNTPQLCGGCYSGFHTIRLTCTWDGEWGVLLTEIMPSLWPLVGTESLFRWAGCLSPCSSSPQTLT